jgi:hypothetical protein
MDIVNTENVWANELSISVGSDAVYVTATMFSTDVDEEIDTFVESRAWILNKQTLYSSVANPSAANVAIDGTINNFSPTIFSDVMPFDLDGAKLGPYVPAAGPDSGAYFVAYNDQATTDEEELHVVQITNPLTALSVSTTILSIGDSDIDGVGGPLPLASQPDDEYSAIETGNRRVNDAVLFDNILHVAITVEDVQDQTAVFWAKIDVQTMTTGDSGLITGETIAPGTSTFFPSIAVNNAGDLVIGYGASGGTVFAGMYASVASTAIESPHVEVKAGEDNYESIDGITYHGQYSGMSADPVENNCFWAFNSFARMNAPLEWNTWERGALGVQWGKVCLQ